MSNGAQAAAARRRARSPPHGALTRDAPGASDASFMGLLFDDALDADGAPEAAQISHSQIIERQAETIARLEASAARAKEYKTLTKVKLKEAAQRLKEYRLRVEALMGEVEAAKSDVAKLEAEKKKTLAQVQMLKKKADAKAPAPVAAKKPVTKSVAVQTEAKAVRSTLVQTQANAREMQTQTDTAAEPLPQAKRIAQAAQVGTVERRTPVVAREKAVEKEQPKAAVATPQAVVKQTMAVVPSAQVMKQATPEKPVQVNAPVVAAASVFDAISATIDAELDFSDEEDEEEPEKLTSAAAAATPATDQRAAAVAERATPSALLASLQDDAISREIDAELDFGSSSDDSSSSSSSEDGDENDDDNDGKVELEKSTAEAAQEPHVSKGTTGENGMAFPGAEALATAEVGDADAITAAIDAELASSSDDEAHDAALGELLESATDPLLPSPRQDPTASVRLGIPIESSLTNDAPVNAIAETAVADVPPTGDVNMTLMTMPATIGSAVDDISAALDAELATSSSEDENEQEETAEPSAKQAIDVSPSPVKRITLSDDVEMAEPTEPDVKPVERIPLQAQELSSETARVEQVAVRVVDETKEHADKGTEAGQPSPTLEEVLREKSRALSLSSDSDSDSSTTSSSASEHDDTVGSEVTPNAVPARPEVAARSASMAAQGSEKPPFVPVESIWAASIAKNASSAASLGSPERTLKVRNKREADARESVAEPEAKRQKTQSPGDAQTPSAPATEQQEAASSQIQQNGSSVNSEPGADKPALVKRRTQPSALPPRAWASYKISIAPQEGENVDVQYVTRTLGLLLKQVSSFLTRAANGIGFRRDFYAQVNKNEDVLKLCKMLADEYHHRHVACAVLVDAMTRVLRTPRTRQLVDRSLVVISVLFRNVLFRRLRLDGDESGLVSDLHVCLLHLRSQVVAGSVDKGLALPRSAGTDPGSVAALADSVSSKSWSTSSTKTHAMSHEVAFLAHVCAFHAAICQTVDRSDIARVLLVDVLKSHPNIKGLYCIHAMVQVDPLILQKLWDEQGRERRSALRAVVIHVLLVIAAQSREKQETVLFKETAATLMSVIADAIDEPQLEPVGYSHGRGFGGPSNESIHEFQATLWRDHIVPCVIEASSDVELVDTASALELLGAFHGDAMMGRHFALFKFQNLLTTEDRTDQEDGAVNAESSGKLRRPGAVGFVKIVRLVGALSRGVLRSHSIDHGVSLFVVDEAVRWMVDTWLTTEHEAGDGTLVLQESVVAELTGILLRMSSQPLDHPKLAQRKDAALHQLLSWLTPSRLAALSPTSLRQLRLLVVAARPLIETT